MATKPPELEALAKYPKMAAWFDPVLLVRLLWRVILSGMFGQYADRRLIVAALEQKQVVDLYAAARKYHLDALVEVHTRDELERALEIGPKIIGINNRNLGTFDVDLSVTEELCKHVSDDVVLVSESGIKTAEDVARLRGCGVDAILVGEALMRGGTSPRR